ncbi:MAG: diadenylate cyclase CdaA [Bacillota bacterium]|nr:diadenylate cyclase CdaA [Bacillota bacterium]
MSGLVNFFNSLKGTITAQLSGRIILTLIDLFIVGYLVYVIINLIKETRAAQLMKGIIVLVVMLELSDLFGLETTNFFLKNSMQVGVIAILIVFQPELRSALERFGRGKFGLEFINMDDPEAIKKAKEAITEVCEACDIMSKKRIGALIVFERQTKLGDIVKSGTVVDGIISSSFLVNIFYTGSPLHDGALIVRNSRAYAAGCFLPLTQNNDLSRELGTRHRAALGISENSDAFVVVVSEESGIISTVSRGNIVRGYNAEELSAELIKNLTEHSEKKPIRPFTKLFRKDKKQ